MFYLSSMFASMFFALCIWSTSTLHCNQLISQEVTQLSVISIKYFFMPLPQTCVDDIFQCVSYMFIMPIIMLCGLVGSIATFFVLTGAKFKTNIFFYLKALSLSDMLYLLAAFGYIYELFFLQTNTVSRVAKEILYLQD